LRDLIRDVANLDGDGAPLVGQAFGGNTPRIRINKFETETEKDEQKGFEQLLRGLYQGVRNPRTHEKIDDKKQTADAIIVFVDYVASIIGKAKGPFTLDDWMNRVFDPDFYRSERYAQLLASEVPPKKQGEVLSALYRNMGMGNHENLTLVFRTLIGLAGDEKLDGLISVVSEELQTTQDDATIRRTLDMLPERLWPRVSEVARLRIENKLIKSIESGKANSLTRKTSGGGLGTWARDISPHFSLKAELYQILLKKLRGTEEEQAYVGLFFWSILPHNFEKLTNESAKVYWIDAICKAVSETRSSVIREYLANSLSKFPEDWRTLILEKLKPLAESDPNYYASLTNFDETEIPF
jgi:uncharacterized protein (TIGR02391 family)